MPSFNAPTEEEVEDAIKAIAQAVSMETIVIPQHLLAIEDGENTGTFRSPLDSNRVNALMFWQSAILPPDSSPLKTGPEPSTFPSRLSSQGRLQVEGWVYTFRFYYGAETGSDSINSKRTFRAKVRALNNAFANKPKLGIDSIRVSHGGLWWPLLTTLSANDQQIETGHGQLTVVVHQAATPTA